MKGGYRIFWTDHALEELRHTVEYLQKNFTDQEITRLASVIEATLVNISNNPHLYPASAHSEEVRRAVILRFNSLYYRVKAEKKQIEIISFFANRREPRPRV